jgi:drug/metabolite transporter (DMT)-like permease
MPVSRAASFLYLLPPVATLISFVWLKELPALSALLGGFLALSGVVIVNTLGRLPPRLG